MRILIADDVPSILMLIASMVRRRGHEAVMVADGGAALEAIRQAPFDLLLLDIQMPGMDGTDCAREVRRLPVESQPQLMLALTGVSDDDQIQAILDAGFDDVLAKPLTGAQLEAVLARIT